MKVAVSAYCNPQTTGQKEHAYDDPNMQFDQDQSRARLFFPSCLLLFQPPAAYLALSEEDMVLHFYC